MYYSNFEFPKVTFFSLVLQGKRIFHDELYGILMIFNMCLHLSECVLYIKTCLTVRRRYLLQLAQENGDCKNTGGTCGRRDFMGAVKAYTCQESRLQGGAESCSAQLSKPARPSAVNRILLKNHGCLVLRHYQLNWNSYAWFAFPPGFV